MRHLAATLAFAFLIAPVSAAEVGFEPLTQWRAYNGDGVPSTWQVSGGNISHTPGGGDLVTVETFGNFELAFDWRIELGGNSGIMYRVVESADAPHSTGPEYQILDNLGHPDGRSPLTSAASAYGLYAPREDVTRAAGDWNSGRILVDGTHVEHWLNDVKVLEFELGSDDWKARVAASKFAGFPNYGAAPEGHITLQDHGASVDFRNIRIKRLSG